MNKTPFEIRLELTHLAKAMLDQQLAIQVEMAKKAFELATATNREAVAQWETFQPRMYTVDEILDLATKMNAFISQPTR